LPETASGIWHAALPAADQRQSRGLREDPARRLGLQAALTTRLPNESPPCRASSATTMATDRMAAWVAARRWLGCKPSTTWWCRTA